jgi:hypothetical protein
LAPLARNRVRVRQVSAPAISTVSVRPAWMSRQAWLTSVCQQQPRIAVAPREHADDADRVHGLENPWIRGGAGRRHHQVDGLDAWMVVVLVDLAIADEDGRPWVDGHGF